MAVVTPEGGSTYWIDGDPLAGLLHPTAPPDTSTATFWTADGDPFAALLVESAPPLKVVAGTGQIFGVATVTGVAPVEAAGLIQGRATVSFQRYPVVSAGSTYWLDGEVLDLLRAAMPPTDTTFATYWFNGAVYGDTTPTAQTRVQAADTVHVGEFVRLLASVIKLVVSDAVLVEDVADPDPLYGIRVIERIHVTDSERHHFGPIYLRKFETITVKDNAARNAKPANRKTTQDFLRVSDVVKAQLYIGGGLAVRVADEVSVGESPMYVGYPPTEGAPGLPNYGTIAIGPNPGVPAEGLGDDYWTLPHSEMPPVRTLIVHPWMLWSRIALASITASLGDLYDPVNYPLSALVDGLPFAVCRFSTLSAGIKLTFHSAVPVKVVGLINHNLDPHLHIEVLVNGAKVPHTFSVQYPHCWIDLRRLASLTNPDASIFANSIEVRVYGNSCPVALSDVVAGDAITLDGTVEIPFGEQFGSAMYRHYSEEYATKAWASGSPVRSTSLQLHAPLAKWQQLEAMSASIGTVDMPQADHLRVIVIPSSDNNDIWCVRWPTHIPGVYELSGQRVAAQLELVEDAMGILPYENPFGTALRVLEVKRDFEVTGYQIGAGTSLAYRPDAIGGTYQRARCVGPTATSDVTEGLLARLWEVLTEEGMREAGAL